MVYELIISEKPQAAEKIAKALADSQPQKIRDKVNYFQLTHKGKNIIVASAVGHLYGLAQREGNTWSYPQFDVEWRATYEGSKDLAYTKDYVKTLEKLGKDASEVTVACDFDIEGEVIGLNVVRFALKREDANRMKFSTLTKGDIIKAYENKQNHLEWGQAKAGDTRHHLDWFYGMNLSRAFTQALKNATNSFKVLSTGRVQGPALHFLANRERRIQAFIPEEFSEIYAHGECKSTKLKAQYELPYEIAKAQNEKRIIQKTSVDDSDDVEEDDGSEQEDGITSKIDRYKSFDTNFTNTVVKETEGKDGVITSIQAKQFKQKVPLPFDLTTLQMEASNHLGLSPKRTLEIAQKLYVEGITSYPRTSSQKLPKELNLNEVLDKLEKQPQFRDKVKLVKSVNPQLKPNEGKKDDPAHPAIHPTGEIPKKLEGQEARVYDLIAKRFFAVFGKDATRETQTIIIDINSHNFVLKGTRTVDPQWHLLYEPYLKFEDVTLPKLEEGTTFDNKEIERISKETSPPKRYTDSSIIKELEKRNLGTKATRADILDNLKKRGYIIGKSIQVTELGLEMDKVLSEETPKLVDEALTRQFEEEMELIREEKSTPEKVLGSAKKELLLILEDISKNEEKLGHKLADASNIARAVLGTIGKCPKCGDTQGGKAVIKNSPKTKKKFAACDKYPNCDFILPVPQMPIVRALQQDEEQDDGKLYVLAGKSEGNLRKICITDTPEKEEEELGHKKYEEEGMTCPNCNEGKMILRKSFYGEFLGCNNYPKCKTMMKIVQGKVDTTPISPVAKKKAPAKKSSTTKKASSSTKKSTSAKKTTTKKEK
ncbi:MAG: topoisomerase DNA-binding C4 zinc finger domain-containing protein [Nanoarchaeota archaeon]|nr:topoisomerase DNA-binding C4 zinc finger domain-containing protein [Nanoarchaeota archaeon]